MCNILLKYVDEFFFNIIGSVKNLKSNKHIKFYTRYF